MSLEYATFPTENILGISRNSHTPSSSGVSFSNFARRTTADVTAEKGGGASKGAQISVKLKRKIAQPHRETDVRFLARNTIISSSGFAQINLRMESIAHGSIRA